ncbi:MAG TPA: hypothetical protein VHY58_06855 [Streptosporangiaceae bacterium]|jgi:hypothetical protein|nr:hypothetical protein [Streptosporangiaceae bacterium]
MAHRLVRSGVAAVVATGAILAGALPAQAVGPPPGYDFAIIYYSNASYTTVVGEHWAGPCPGPSWGTTSSYIRGFQQACPVE